MPVLLWALLIVDMSRQSYAEQSIQPILHKLASKEVLSDYMPDMTIRYHGTVIVAKRDPYRFIEFGFRKGAHFFVYAVLAVAASAGLSAWAGQCRRSWAIPVCAILITLIVSLLDEGLQSKALMRTPAIQDVVVDQIGAATGSLIYRWSFNRKKR